VKRFLIFLPILSFGASLYLPIDSSISDDVEKMAVLTNMPTSKMPYSLEMVKKYNEMIKLTSPKLYNKILQKTQEVENKEILVKDNLSITLSLSDNKSELSNESGKDTKYSYLLEGSYFVNINEYLKGSLEGAIYQDESRLKFATNSTFLSAGIDMFQLDVGFREHYYGSFKNGALLISKNAINSPSITISNNTPFSFGSINYEVFLTKLKKTDGILYDGTDHTGSPRLLGMHLDFSPIDRVEVSLDRTFQFGGGPRSSSASDIWGAFIDPVSNDNTNENLNTDNETGNQQASLNFKYNDKFFGKDISLYATYSGEDTNGGNYKLGNVVQGFGFYLPTFTQNSSFRYEFLDIGEAWYVHHLYKNGYKNGSTVLGNWFGDKVNANIESNLHFVEVGSEFDDVFVKTKLKYLTPKSAYKVIEPNSYYALDTSFAFSKTFQYKINYLFEKKLNGEKVNFVSYEMSF